MLFASQKWRVSHDKVRNWPYWFPRLLWHAQIQNRIHVLDILERLEHRVAGGHEAVLQHPLQVANPDDDLGKFLSKGVDFDAKELVGADVGEPAEIELR